MSPTPSNVTAEEDQRVTESDDSEATQEEQPTTSTIAANSLSAAPQSPSATDSRAFINSTTSFYDSCMLTPPDMPSDEDLSCYDLNEPRYCICNQISYGTMIACENEACPYEWFHLQCVSIKRPPKGSWYCPLCAASMRWSGGRKRKLS